MASEETKEAILSRLQLAQQILEESDRLVGLNGYDLKGNNWWFHPRHEREALVIYLLLTCFDKLGQKGNFIAFHDWLNSKKGCHQKQKEEIKNSLPENLDVIESGLRLFEGYQAIYGVRNAFYDGITGLPEGARNHLLRSVEVSFNTEFGMYGPNVSTPSQSLEDKELELNLKLKFLYGKRNRFTHKLDQYHRCSAPMLSENRFKDGSSWVVMIKEKRIFYMGSQQEHEKLSTGGAYVYTVKNWPFVLFEALYEALGIAFDRTSIDLKFMVMVMVMVNSDDGSYITSYNNIDHKHLKDYDLFLKMTGA